ncbi:MAG: 4Fe-4S binding protein [Candidatus Nezhaarchaeota archaeon]|nr:4Fe-4S binding protein [Candidatus Nezhaarchaeota archaeon]
MYKRLVIADVDRCVGCQCCMFACTRRLGEAGLGKAAIHVRSAGGVERGYVIIVCRACPDPPCFKACPADALKKRPKGGVLVDYDLCIGCGACQGACPFGAIKWDLDLDKPIVCIHCGYCVEFCPHKVLALEEVS